MALEVLVFNVGAYLNLSCGFAKHTIDPGGYMLSRQA